MKKGRPQPEVRRDGILLTLVKGLAIIELFDGTRYELTAAEAARIARISRAAARRCLLTLASLGYVKHHMDGNYFTPKPRLMRLGRGYASSTPFFQAAQSLLDETRDAIDDSVALAVRDDAEVLFIARASVTHFVMTGVGVGKRVPVFCSASGRILLSEFEEREQRRILAINDRVARTDKTVCNLASLLKILKQVHVAQVAYNDEELELGMRSMAVPVRRKDGTICAAISSSAPSAQMTISQLAIAREAILRNTAQRMSELLVDFGADAIL